MHHLKPKRMVAMVITRHDIQNPSGQVNSLKQSLSANTDQ